MDSEIMDITDIKLRLPKGHEIPQDLLDSVLHEVVSENKKMMSQLWINWCHLGYEMPTKIEHIRKIPDFVRKLNERILLETEEKIKNILTDIKNQQATAQVVAQILPVDVKLPPMGDEMTLSEYVEVIKDTVERLQKIVEEREAEYERLLEREQMLVELMGVRPQEPAARLPSEEELKEFRRKIEMLEEERLKRMQIYCFDQSFIREIMRDRLKIGPETQFQQKVLTTLSSQFDLSDQNMALLAKLKQEMQDRYEKTNNRVLELRERLHKLWDSLSIPEDYREEFLRRNQGCHAAAEEAVAGEIERCEEKRRLLAKELLLKVREKIAEMWDKLHYGPKTRLEFQYYQTEYFCDDVVELHEVYLQRLQSRYFQYRDIYELYESRSQLWEKLQAIEARQNEPGRLYNRGGKLLQEEKERKVIISKLPKVEESLKALDAQYREKGETITVDDMPISEKIDRDWDTIKAERADKVASRKRTAENPPTPSPVNGYRLGASASKRSATKSTLTPTARSTRSYCRTPHPVTPQGKKLFASPSTVPRKRRSGSANDIKSFIKRMLVEKPPTVNATTLKYKYASKKRRSSGRKSLTKNSSVVRAPSTVAEASLDSQRSNDMADNTENFTYSVFESEVPNQARSSDIMGGAQVMPKLQLNSAPIPQTPPVLARKRPAAACTPRCVPPSPRTPLSLRRPNLRSQSSLAQTPRGTPLRQQ